MLLSFNEFMHHTGMSPTDPRAIPEYEIMLRIGTMLPANTPPSVLRRLWRDAFHSAAPEDRHKTYRVHKGAFI